MTNSIENTSTAEVFNTEIVRLTAFNIKQIKEPDWQFKWHKELKDKTKEFISLQPSIIQQLFRDL